MGGTEMDETGDSLENVMDGFRKKILERAEHLSDAQKADIDIRFGDMKSELQGQVQRLSEELKDLPGLDLEAPGGTSQAPPGDEAPLAT
ncbi:MAG: hypothetical protein JWP91_2918 [Fibrobacteres bacterium]|nr:hypothetical protein [Fibrobacterota bacterium]